jgi:aminoglycoside phosphotransferase (APT) family kinase protein
VDETAPRPGDAEPAVGLDVEPGPKLAAGRDADVFDLENGRVLRRNRVRDKSCELEAQVMRFVHDWSFPVPAVYEVSGPDMVMDRVDGPTMLVDLGKRPWMLWQHARTLAKLHRQLHGIPAPDWVPTYASHPAFASDDAPADRTSDARTAPAVPDALLHLDLHPDNVILSPSGPVVIDWRNTRRGDGDVDVATTWLIMATSQVSDTGPRHRMVRLIRGLFVDALLRNVDRRAAERQLPRVARYRLADRNLLPSERPAIHALLRQHTAIDSLALDATRPGRSR